MNRVVIAILAITGLFTGSCHSQPPKSSEFEIKSNGLIYSDADMKHLRFIVDSLNLKFKTCDLSKKFYAAPQAIATYIQFVSKTDKLKDVLADLKAGLKPEIMMTKYKKYIEASGTRLLVKSESNEYLVGGEPNNGYQSLYDFEISKLNLNVDKNQWLYDYTPIQEGLYQSNRIECYFLSSEFKINPIPEKYARLIQYVDCMIDTNSLISLVKDKEREPSSQGYDYIKSLNNYINKAMHAKKNGRDDWEFEYLSDKKVDWAINNLKSDKEFNRMVRETANDCMENNCGSEQIEDLVAGFISKETALQMKRSRRVVGNCSMDQSPRIHALSIAKLAAETHSWDIFLRSHLDIMNDRFERRSDGSWAWQGRMTYLKELEELDLNVVDLMLGLTLHASNAATNHYFGTIWRLGRALVESKDKALFEKNALTMMQDPDLDPFNRGLVYLLYVSYSHYFEGKEGKAKRDVLRNTIRDFPAEIQAAINNLQEPEKSK